LSAVMPHATSMDIRAATRFCFTTVSLARIVLTGLCGEDMPTAYTRLCIRSQQGRDRKCFVSMIHGLRAVYSPAIPKV
jgi:hypothetical protein